MLRYFIALCFISGLTGLAHAKPISTQDVESELAKRNAFSLKSAYLSGFPVVTGQIGGHGFTAVLQDCFESLSACEAVRFKACRAQYTMPRESLLETVNQYNSKFNPGTAFVAYGQGVGEVMCVKQQFDFSDENTFDLDEVFFWERTVEAFMTFADARVRSHQARAIMGR